MNKKSIAPNPRQPVERQPAGKLPSALAELNEAALSDTNTALSSGHMAKLPGIPDWFNMGGLFCAYEGDDE